MLFIDRRQPRLQRWRRRADSPASGRPAAIAGADLDLVEAVQHVELGQRDAVDAAGDAGLAHQHGVEPAAAALAPGHGAELVAALAQLFADGVVQLGGEGAFADAGGVGS